MLMLAVGALSCAIEAWNKEDKKKTQCTVYEGPHGEIHEGKESWLTPYLYNSMIFVHFHWTVCNLYIGIKLFHAFLKFVEFILQTVLIIVYISFCSLQISSAWNNNGFETIDTICFSFVTITHGWTTMPTMPNPEHSPCTTPLGWVPSEKGLVGRLGWMGIVQGKIVLVLNVQMGIVLGKLSGWELSFGNCWGGIVQEPYKYVLNLDNPQNHGDASPCIVWMVGCHTL